MEVREERLCIPADEKGGRSRQRFRGPVGGESKYESLGERRWGGDQP